MSATDYAMLSDSGAKSNIENFPQTVGMNIIF